MNSAERYGEGESIIREALRRELESAPLSSPEPAWARIRTGLHREGKNRGAAFMRLHPMRRFVVAAALLLVVLAGGLALGGSGILPLPGFLGRDCKQAGAEEGKAAEDMSLNAGSSAVLCGGFIPVNMDEGDYFQAVDHFPAALYRRGSESLLWISAPSFPSTDLPLFIAEIGCQLGSEIEILDEEAAVRGHCGGILEFEAGGRSGIAWPVEGGLCALLALSGSPDLHALISLWNTGEQPCCPLE